MSLSKVPFSFFVAFPVAGLGVCLAIWLVFGLRFDLETSPGWQLVLSTSWRCSVPWSCRLSWEFSGVSLGWAEPGSCCRFFHSWPWVCSWGWPCVQGGELPCMGLRDGRLFPVVMRSASLSVIVIGILALFQALVMLTAIIAYRRDLRWALSIPVVSRIVLRSWSADVDDLGKGRVGR